jgi:long-chain acyl-CoA synthetase
MTPPANSVPVGRVVARLAKQVELGLATLDLTPPQYRLLFSLAEGTSAASALADNLAVTKPSVTAVVDGLVERGLVQRRHDETDRRRVSHDLTPKGRDVLVAADEAVHARLSEIVGYLDGDEQPVAMSTMGIWQRALNGYRDARTRLTKAGRP